jgi:hypothetical protein
VDVNPGLDRENDRKEARPASPAVPVGLPRADCGEICHVLAHWDCTG